MAIYKIFAEAGHVENRIVADEAYVLEFYPGRYEIESDNDEQETTEESEPELALDPAE